jgi:ketosteroid isomerase-like protein
MKVIQLVLTACLFIFLSPVYAQMVDQKAEQEELMKLSREWAKAAQGTDTEKILSYWAEDALLIPPDQASLRGHEQLEKMLEGASGIPGFEVNWEPKEAYVSKSGELGYVIAHKYFKFPDATGKINTAYFIEVGIWKKQENGKWKNTIDIYNPDPSITSIK